MIRKYKKTWMIEKVYFLGGSAICGLNPLRSDFLFHWYRIRFVFCFLGSSVWFLLYKMMSCSTDEHGSWLGFWVVETDNGCAAWSLLNRLVSIDITCTSWQHFYLGCFLYSPNSYLVSFKHMNTTVWLMFKAMSAQFCWDSHCAFQGTLNCQCPRPKESLVV